MNAEISTDPISLISIKSKSVDKITQPDPNDTRGIRQTGAS